MARYTAYYAPLIYLLWLLPRDMLTDGRWVDAELCQLSTLALDFLCQANFAAYPKKLQNVMISPQLLDGIDA